MRHGKDATLRELLVRASTVEKWTVATVLVATVLFAAFALLAREVYEGDTLAFDRRILLLMRATSDPTVAVGPAWLKEAMRDITALGSTSVLTIVVLAVSGFLAVAGLRHAAAMVLASVVSGVLLSDSLKVGFGRARPDLVPHEVPVYTASFPSGHAMLSAVVYFTLGALLCRTQASLAIKAYIIAIAVLLAVMVGISRVFLGVHWPTDVIAGWLLGAIWAGALLTCAGLWGHVRGGHPATTLSAHAA